METLCLACCFIGTGLLILSVILCIVSDNIILWQVILIIGEIVAFFGYMPVFFKNSFESRRMQRSYSLSVDFEAPF